ncbi:cellulose biosynthesis protein BcsG [Algiphilus sp.]|uniref:cellulose biosynthesis protein BcsG n=1 Tax=Algiphilus sp. TaxID=1872431 RepID=UPI0032EC3956
MGWWSFYFLLKLAAYAAGSMAFDWRLNLALALFVLLPLRGARRWVQQILAIPAGVALLYHDAHLPPFSRFIAELDTLAHFDLIYLQELAARVIGWEDVALLAGIALIYWLLSAKLRMASFALLGILLVPLVPLVGAWSWSAAPTPDRTAMPANRDGTTETAARSPEAELEAFYRASTQRRAPFNAMDLDGAPFDIVFLHVCSLAWDDLDLYGMASHPLLQRRDIGFEAFNTVATYSGPAALRLARATCGQQSHDGLYSAPEEECLLFHQLQRHGYQPQLITNWSDSAGVHDFIPKLRSLGGLDAPQRAFGDAPITMRTYDGESLYSDDALLDQWRADRRAAPDQRVALYYNTNSLHDGNRLIDRPRVSSTDTYPDRLRKLLDDLNGFIDALEASGRTTVVVLIPEHGAALRGDALQISGMREIPTPAITLAPVGIYLTGGGQAHTPVRIDSPTSYFALGTLLKRFVADNPFSADAPALARYVDDLPATRLVSVNEGAIVMRKDDQFLRRDISGSWTPLRTGLGRGAALLDQPPVPLSPTAGISDRDRD